MASMHVLLLTRSSLAVPEAAVPAPPLPPPAAPKSCYLQCKREQIARLQTRDQVRQDHSGGCL